MYLFYQELELRTAADIAQFSFIVQNSVSALNLELCQSYYLETEHVGQAPFSHSKGFINTEEKCRKVRTGSRSLLDTLHLDLPKDVEKSLKSGWEPVEFIHIHTSDALQRISEIRIEEGFYGWTLEKLALAACCPKSNLKVIKWFIKDNFEKQDSNWPQQLIVDYAIDHKDSELEDPEFVKECFTDLDVGDWLRYTPQYEGISNVLYQIHGTGKDLVWIDEFVNSCLLETIFIFVGDVLKFQDTPKMCNLYDFLSEKISNSGSLSPRRQTLLLQLLCAAANFRYSTEFLRLIWNSVPDSLLSSNEITEAFEDQRGTIALISEYSKAVGGIRSFVEPRSLKHYSRVAIRRRLYELKHWLPEGIEKLCVPEKLQSYLKLEI